METVARIVSDAALGKPYAIAFVLLVILAITTVAIVASVLVRYRRFL